MTIAVHLWGWSIRLQAMPSTRRKASTFQMSTIGQASGGNDGALQAIFDRIAEGIICCDLHGVITLINRSAAQLLNWLPESAIGQNLDAVFPTVLEILKADPGLAEYTLDAVRDDGTRISVHAGVEYWADCTNCCFIITLQSHQAVADRVRESARLAAIVESSDDAIIGKTMRGIITSWNKGAERIFGYSAAEAIGQHISLVIPPGREEEEPKIVERLTAGERVDHFDTVRVAKDGHFIDVSLTISPIRDEIGTIVGASKIARDISEQKRAATHREEIEQRMRLAIEAAEIGIWDWDLKSGEMIWSHRVASLLGVGLPPGDFKSFEECIHPLDRESVIGRISAALNSRSDYRDEFRVLWTDGTVHNVEARGHTFDDDAGAPRRMTGTIIDVTEKKLAQEAVQRLQVVADVAKIGFWEWDLATGEVTRSPQHAKLVGSAIGASVFQAKPSNIHPDDFKVTRAALLNALHSRQEYVSEFRATQQDGSVLWLEERGRGRYLENGNATGMMGILLDITARKKAEQENRLREAELAHLSRISTMGNLASGLAHELNQPLGAILNYGGVCVNLARSSQQDMAKVLVALEELVSETRRAGAIINRMRSFATRQMPKADGLDLNDLANKSVSMLDFELRAQSVKIAWRLSADLPQIVADSIQIQQVIVNLVYNAMQAMSEMRPAERQVTIQTNRPDSATVELSVIDNGPGIKAEHFARLFEPFFTTKPQGMGMGLNISRSIIESQGGRLSASREQTGGMRFSFTLPI